MRIRDILQDVLEKLPREELPGGPPHQASLKPQVLDFIKWITHGTDSTFQHSFASHIYCPPESVTDGSVLHAPDTSGQDKAMQQLALMLIYISSKFCELYHVLAFPPLPCLLYLAVFDRRQDVESD